MRVAALRVLDAETGDVQHEVPHEGAVFTVAWHPSGTQVATGCYDDKLRVVNARTGQVEHVVAHGGTVWGLAWSP
jgi:WD40 repeat protein